MTTTADRPHAAPRLARMIAGLAKLRPARVLTPRAPHPRIEDLPDWLLHDIGLTRGGIRIDTRGRPMRPAGYGEMH